MPTYEYACRACGHQWEEIQKITEDAVEVCPKCNKKTAQRQISGGNFILKGGGWYADLYSSAKPSASKKEEASGGEKGSSGGSGDAGGASGGSSESTSGASGEKAGSSGSKAPPEGASSPPGASTSKPGGGKSSGGGGGK
jgi:putative FmdB family regulatory protein